MTTAFLTSLCVPRVPRNSLVLPLRTSGFTLSTFEKLGLKSALIIDGAQLENNFARAARNIPNIDVLPVQGINVYDIMRRDTLVLTKSAVDALEARFR